MQLAGQLIVHVARGQLVLVGALARDAPVLLAIELLHRVGDLLELYFKELSEEALRANFVTVYQLLDEEVLPTYADAQRWGEIMRHCIALGGSFFNAQRMVETYMQRAYKLVRRE